jgi:hypothetical protein
VVQVFVTSRGVDDANLFDGNVGGLDGADTKCTDAADDGGTWTAWLSDPNGNARDRIRDGEYQLLNGTVVANDKADLTDGSLDAAIDLDENLDTVQSGFESHVWTATETDGNYGDSGTCFNWTSNDALDFGQVGESTAVDGTWTDVDPGGSVGGNNCAGVNRLYCFADATSN